MRTRTVVAALALSFSLASSGCVYADVTAPLDTDLNQTTLGDKQGESSAHSVLWLVAWGDAGTKAAAEDGGLQTINHADQKFFSLLWGLYSRSTTVVYGQ
ncbi:MAG: TRL-like family protein [bacterium]|nr:TRL-like family protein [bacterium]